LDDPLSAVDSPTAAHLLNYCILGLLKDKTIVIVTHAINLVLPKCGKVIALKGGCVVFDGTPEQIMNSDQAYLLPADFNSVEGEVLPSLDFDGHAVKSIAGIDNLEGKATGSVKWNTYRSYIMACGGLGFVLALFFSFLVQTASNYLSSWWVQVWTDSYDKLDVLQSLYHYYNQNVGTETKSSAYYITIFGLVSLLELVGLLLKYTIQFFGGMRASRKLHEELLVSVLGSPMRFFEITPVGRFFIIN
jgi:ABC-type multidrug transport system fused ATPase/permease subunit